MREVAAALGLSLILALGCVPKDTSGSDTATATMGTTGDETSTGSDSTTATGSDSTTATGSDSTTATGSGSDTSTGGAGVGEPCAPVAELGGGRSTCGAGLVCCSDDPAAQEGKLPAYGGKVPDALYGLPIFSESNNSLSHTGVCVPDEGIVTPLLNGCVSPCNPRWLPNDIAEACGGGLCCQTTPLGPNDCVLDPETSRWRTLTGADILAGLTTWGASVSTPQDPMATSCQIFAGANTGPIFNDCVAQLTVADRRGLCSAAACPCVEDTCELLNPDSVPRCR